MEFYEIKSILPFRKHRKAIVCENGMYAYAYCNRFGAWANEWIYSDFIYPTCKKAAKGLREVLTQKKHGS